MLQLVKSMPDLIHPGDVLEGRYRLQRVIGDGGMGTVFLGEHVLIKRRYAIKVLHRELAQDPEVVERFMNEARAAGTLGHPNIVESTDMGFARNDVPYIVFEYLEGTPLANEIYRLRGLPVRRALKIALQIASALAAAHGAGIIHRDLKTENIFLTDKDDALDVVKVLDFGISRFLQADSDRTGRGGKRGAVMMGTPEFMAPEQIVSPERVDERTDIYALGVVLYEMLAGRTPFVTANRADPHEVLHRVLLDRPPAFERRDLPVGLADMILDKLLAKDPSARYRSMTEVGGALEAFASVLRPTLPEVADPVSLPVPPPVLAAKRRRWPWIVAGVLAGGATATGFMLWPRTQTARAPVTIAAPVVVSAPSAPAADTSPAELDAAATAALLRAESIAASPMLRAAIETDAATLQDMARDGAVIIPQPGETIEIFQATTSLLRLPTMATSLPVLPAKTVRVIGHQLVASATVLAQSGKPAGSVSLAVPIDARLAAAVPRSKLVQPN
jgi:serine/threonine-protein kinase